MARWPIRTIEERFWSHVDKDGPIPARCPERGACWIWTGYRTKKGYGKFGTTADKIIFAHRFLLGEIPEGLESDHACDNRACVRPDHIDLRTHAENVARSASGHYQRVKTHCPKGHEYTPENTLRRATSKHGLRACRQCDRDRKRRRPAEAVA